MTVTVSISLKKREDDEQFLRDQRDRTQAARS